LTTRSEKRVPVPEGRTMGAESSLGDGKCLGA
jgi:hypothetical protein